MKFAVSVAFVISLAALAIAAPVVEMKRTAYVEEPDIADYKVSLLPQRR